MGSGEPARPFAVCRATSWSSSGSALCAAYVCRATPSRLGRCCADSSLLLVWQPAGSVARERSTPLDAHARPLPLSRRHTAPMSVLLVGAGEREVRRRVAREDLELAAG